MEERWKDIPGFPGYQASTYGRIRSHNKVTSSKRFPVRHWKDGVLKPKVSTKDHCGRVSLWVDGKHNDVLVHRLVATTFLEPLMDTNMTVNHKDGNRLNNRIDNLEWMTREDNIRHGFRTGLYASNMVRCKIYDDDGNEYEFLSLSDASRFLSQSTGYISNASKKGLSVRDRVTGKRYSIKREC